MKNKTVYVLGAGFTKPIGAPFQNEIIQEIFNLRTIYPKPNNVQVNEWIDKLELFMREDLCVTDVERDNYTLEDVYTPIDKAIMDATSFRKHDSKQLLELRENINNLIILSVRETIKKKHRSEAYLTDFANHLISLSKEKINDAEADRVSVITTNWDIELDNAINEIIKSEPFAPKQNFIGVVDYCCYISSLDKDDDDIKPGLYALGRGGFNVKILKLHGSMNWLQCPNCQRLYVKFYRSFPGGNVTNPFYCRHCQENFKQGEDRNIRLVTNMIMPTFLKNLSNIQNRLIWQNAGIELSEASKVVFIGYSLPYADYEFKQLLSKMIRSDAEIEVVLFGNDDPDKCDPKYKHLTAGYRFINFFSGRNLKNDGIDYLGVKNYIDGLK